MGGQHRTWKRLRRKIEFGFSEAWTPAAIGKDPGPFPLGPGPHASMGAVDLTIPCWVAFPQSQNQWTLEPMPEKSTGSAADFGELCSNLSLRAEGSRVAKPFRILPEN